MGGGASGGPAGAVLALLLTVSMAATVGETTWCIARSGASSTALQTALDYACGAGADCTPIQSSGLCYLPNTVQAHASYAFNSYYQRSNMAPGSCDFGGTATVTVTDPSFGSCTYPSSASTAGGVTSTTGLSPTTPTTPALGGGTGVGGGGGVGPTTTTDTSLAADPRRPRLPLFLCVVVAPLLI